MAVEELDARVVGDPAQGDGAAGGDLDGVAAHGSCSCWWVVGEHAAATRAADELHVVAVQMERVRVGVVVLEEDFDDGVVGDDGRCGVRTVDGWIVDICCRRVHCGVEGGHLGCDVVNGVYCASSLAVGVVGEVDGPGKRERDGAELGRCI